MIVEIVIEIESAIVAPIVVVQDHLVIEAQDPQDAKLR